MPKLRQLIAASCCTATLLLAACGKSESEPKTMLYYSQHLDEAREKVARCTSARNQADADRNLSELRIAL